VKVGGSTSEFGKRLILPVRNEDDLKRDVFKSDSASLSIPEIDFELSIGTLGGVYTTVEGLLVKVSDNLKENGLFFSGDSATS
jgi:zinc finger protein